MSLRSELGFARKKLRINLTSAWGAEECLSESSLRFLGGIKHAIAAIGRVEPSLQGPVKIDRIVRCRVEAMKTPAGGQFYKPRRARR